METIQVKSLGDMLKDWVEQIGYSSGISQRVFGNVPTLDQFIDVTKGDIAIQPQLQLVAPLSASLYPFEIYVEYNASPSGVLVPLIGKNIKHYKSIERVTEREYSMMTKDLLGERFSHLAEHRKTKIQMLYHRDAIITYRPM